MRYLIFSLMLAAAAHAITCTEGHLMYDKDFYSLFINKDDAYLDSSTNFTDVLISKKLIREEDRILVIKNKEGKSDTSLYSYLINDINSPVDSSVAYKKSVVGDTTLIEAIVDEPNQGTDLRISKYKIKLFKNGLIADAFRETQENTYEDHFEHILKNDTLFVLELLSVDGAPKDTMEYTLYVADKDDDHLCHEFYRVNFCFGEDGCLGPNDTVVHNGDMVENTGFTLKETETGFVLEGDGGIAIYQDFMVYTDDYVPASIAKRPAARIKQPNRDYYFDTKGRKQFKAIPYRVQF